MAMESLTHLMLNWRSLGGAWLRETGLHQWTYLYGRTMSLRLLLERGEFWPPFPMEPLGNRFREVYPEEERRVQEDILGAVAVGGNSRLWDFVARQTRAMKSSALKAAAA